MLTEAEARAAYERRELHTALIGQAEHPYCFVETTGDSMAVGFLDEDLREYVSYGFQEEQPGRLFLSMAVLRSFVGHSDEVKEGVMYVFRKDGRACVERQVFKADGLAKDESWLERSESQVDITNNWEPYPQFGKYESLARVNRGLCYVSLGK